MSKEKKIKKRNKEHIKKSKLKSRYKIVRVIKEKDSYNLSYDM